LFDYQLLRALIVDIIADIDEAAREVILTIHWRGGHHSQLRVRKPKSGEHGCRTSDKALAAAWRTVGPTRTSVRRPSTENPATTAAAQWFSVKRG
jgi:hypothetical protein